MIKKPTEIFPKASPSVQNDCDIQLIFKADLIVAIER